MIKTTLTCLLMSLMLLAYGQADEGGSNFTSEYLIRPEENSRIIREHAKELVVHRGANHQAPENTYAAAARGIELGIAFVEMDVRRSLDGAHYIILTSARVVLPMAGGPIALRTPLYIDLLDAGSLHDSTCAKEPVPRLNDYLQCIKVQCRVYLDIKDADLNLMMNMIQDLGMEEDVFCWFGDDETSEAFSQLSPDIALKVNASHSERVWQAREALGADIIECNVSRMRAAMLAQCRELDIGIIAYASSNTRDEFEALIRSEADMVNLDRPSLYMQVLGSLQQTNPI